jgi:hypothetical protein
MAGSGRNHAGTPRFVVGGGRAAGFPSLRADDVSLNIAASATPHVLGDIAFAPFGRASCDTLYFERMPFPAFTGGRIDALAEPARLLRPGGRLIIETGWAAPIEQIVARLQAERFIIVTVEQDHEQGGLLRITALMPEA